MANMTVYDENTSYNLIADFGNSQTYYCSMDTSTEDGKVKLFKAMSSPDEKISDCINKKIEIKDIYLDVVGVTNKEGEYNEVPRIVIIDTQGVSYSSISSGFYESMKKFVNIFGTPDTWDKPITIEIKQRETRSGNRTFSFEVVTK